MSTNLMDIIRKNGKAAAAPIIQTGLGTTDAVQSTLQAKTGKAPLASTLGSGNLTEAQGLEQANLALAPVQQQAAAQDLQLSNAQDEQDQKLSQGKAEIQQNKAAVMQDLHAKANNLLNQLAISKEELNVKQKIAGLEQVGFILAQQDKDYMNQLEYEGKRRRLDNDANFKLELQKSALGDMYSLFQDDLAFRSMFNATQREFTRKLAAIDISSAIQIAHTQIQQDNTGAVFTGIGGLASAGAQYYANRSPSAPEPQYESVDSSYNTFNTLQGPGQRGLKER